MDPYLLIFVFGHNLDCNFFKVKIWIVVMEALTFLCPRLLSQKKSPRLLSQKRRRKEILFIC